MEIQGSDGSKLQLKPNSTTIFGRNNGLFSNDLTVSRRQVSFDFNPSFNTTQTAPRVSFEVLGKNPVWVFNNEEEDGKIKTFKRFQRGELGIHDLFCVSSKTPVWFTIEKVDKVFEEGENECEDVNGRINDELSQCLDFVSGFDGIEDSVDVSDIDPVQEFGFLVIGHEFDQYPKQMIHEIKNWHWFLDNPKGNSADKEDSENKGTSSGRRKRKKTNRGDDDDDVDEEWTAESEGEELATNVRKVQRPKYGTRSKDHGVRQKVQRISSAKTSTWEEEEEESEDEEVESLGSFIVTDDDGTLEEDEKDEMDEDEEEEFIEDELED